MKIPFIDLGAQQKRIRAGIEERIRRVLDHGQYILGPEIAELEQSLTELTGSRFAVACSSGTDALLMALMAQDIGPGDAVMTTPFSFFATAEVISLLGATPVFADIEPDTLNISADSIEEHINSKYEGQLRGIIAVDLFGQPADYPAITKIAKKHGLFVVEDGAQAFGASLGNRRAPNMGDIGTVSFFPAKPLGAYGDAGALFCNDESTHQKLRTLLVHGQSQQNRSRNIRIGLNARMDTIQAAILLEKLTIYEDELQRRQDVAALYHKHLGKLGLTLPCVKPDRTCAWAQYCPRSSKRDIIQTALREADIPTATYYPTPLHLQETFLDLGYGVGSFPVAEAVCHEIFALPFHPYLEEEQIAEIANIIGSAQ